MKRIKVLGITGSVGAGKSTVLAYLSERYHAEVLQLDKAAHLLMEPGNLCYERIIQTFGSDILTEHKIDRAKLYQKTFGDEMNLRKLNAIVHPLVKEYVRAWIAKRQTAGKAPFLVLEAALLLEDHYDEICDEIWFIDVEDTVRVRRLMCSRGYTEEKTRQILQAQKSPAEFREACQFVVDNSSDILENTYEQVDKGLKEHEFV